MRASYLLRSATRALAPMQIAFSLFLLLRGHNEPGGGFAAGLVVAAALGLVAISTSVEEARRFLRVDPVRIAGLGLCAAIASGVIGPLTGEEFLTGRWLALDLGGFHLDLGTPLLFDVGVYLLVIGIATAVLFALIATEGDEEWRR